MARDTDDVRRKFRRGAIRGVTLITNDLHGRAQRDAPVREGTLRADSDVEIDDDGDVIEGTVTFNQIYAARQHEELDWEHPLGGRAKYLEGNLAAMAARYELVLAGAIAQEMRR